MARKEALTRFEIDLIDESKGKYLATMQELLVGFNKPLPYRVGDEITLTEDVINGNSSANLISCFVSKIMQDNLLPYRYTFYIKPDFYERVIDGIDWSGSDGWLQLDRK